MEKFSYSSFADADTKLAELKSNGFQETTSIENVPIGTCSANLVLQGKGKNIAPVIQVVTFDRKNDKGETLNLMFTAVCMNVLHISKGKSFNNLLIKATDEVRNALSLPANYTKEILLESVAYGDKGKTILKFDSISK